MRTEIVRSRVDPLVKQEATKILDEMDMSMSSVFNIFLKQLIAERKIPFEIKLPNAKTIEAIKAVQRGEVEETSIEEMMNEWKKWEKEDC